MKVATLEFKKEKETKRTIRFQEVSEEGPPIVGTLYVQKWWVGDAEHVVVTIERREANA